MGDALHTDNLQDEAASEGSSSPWEVVKTLAFSTLTAHDFTGGSSSTQEGVTLRPLDEGNAAQLEIDATGLVMQSAGAVALADQPGVECDLTDLWSDFADGQELWIIARRSGSPDNTNQRDWLEARGSALPYNANGYAASVARGSSVHDARAKSTTKTSSALGFVPDVLAVRLVAGVVQSWYGESWSADVLTDPEGNLTQNGNTALADSRTLSGGTTVALAKIALRSGRNTGTPAHVCTWSHVYALKRAGT